MADIINASEPPDDVLQSELPSYIRATRSAVNAGVLVANSYIMPLAATEIICSDSLIEIMIIDAVEETSLVTLTGGPEGAIRVMTFKNSIAPITLIHQTGNILLDGNPVDQNLQTHDGDVFIFMKDNNGDWRECFRSLVD